MKRCFSAALIVALLGTLPVSPAIAEEAEIVSETVEDSVAEITLLSDADLTGESAEITTEPTYTEAAVLAADAGETESPDETESAEQKAAASETAEAEAEPKAATGIRLNASSISIGLKEKYRGLAVTALPEGSVLPAVAWRSSNSKVVKVNPKTGVIIGKKKGTAKIYAKIAGGKKEVKCKVTVKAQPKKVTLKPKALALSVGMTSQLKASVPSGYASGALTFSSSRKKCAAVDNSTGLITAVAPGTATITVKTYNGKKAKCTVTVTDVPASVAFSDTSLSLAVGQTSALTSTALTSKGDVTPAVIAYSIDESSPDADCVSLDEASGKLTGVSKGQAVIRATAHNGAVGLCLVDVDVAPVSVRLNTNSVDIGVNETYADVVAEFEAPQGADTCARIVKWTSNNKKVAKVDAATGVITGIGTGSCTITAKTPNGVSAKCKVKVNKAPTSKTIEVSPAAGSLVVGKYGSFTVRMASGYGGSVFYESSDTEVATIDNEGVISAISPGTTKITVTTYNGVSKTVNLDVMSDSQSKAAEKSAPQIEYLLAKAQSKLGMPYVYGAFGPNRFDCSGFVYWCYQQINIKLKDSAYKQGYDERYPKIAYDDLRPGDIVVFNTVEDGKNDLSDHTGIYLGNYRFIHASSAGKGVIISSLKKDYYRRTFSWGRRVLYSSPGTPIG